MNCLKIAFLVFALSSAAQAQNILQNMQTAVALDIVAPIDFDNSEDNALNRRVGEIMFYGPLDPTFDANVNFAAHNEDGEYHVEVHEAYVSSSKLIPNSRFKLGTYFLGVGRLNQFHQHDWYFTSAPRVQSEFFDEEGVADSGLEFSTLLPTNSYWDITVGVTNGYTYGHSHDAGERPRVPTHYIHPVNFVDFGDTGSLQWGLNYLGRTDAEGIQTQLYGLDFVFKQTEGKVTNWLLQSEVWYRNLSNPTEATSEELGAYVYSQWALTERLYAGVRVDLFSELSRRFVSDNSKQDNLNYALVPSITFKNSEFALLRATYALDTETYKGESDSTHQRIELQWVAILGAHPAHSF